MKFDTRTIIMAAVAVLLIAGVACLILKRKSGCGCQDAETLTGVENSLGR